MYRFLKRAFDFSASLLALIITSPFFLITTIGIELSDPGPVFYKAKRIGYHGREFCMFKFRSMRVPKHKSEANETSFKADKGRIFPFGDLIRRLKIDELPQLLNILIGDMSIVGPRPASVDQAAVMRAGKYEIANSVRPGLTGPAALYDYIYGDSVEDPVEYERLVLPTRRELEAIYPSRMSVGFDLKMIRWTVICVFAEAFQKETPRIYNQLRSYVSAQVTQAEEKSLLFEEGDLNANAEEDKVSV